MDDLTIEERIDALLSLKHIAAGVPGKYFLFLFFLKFFSKFDVMMSVSHI